MGANVLKPLSLHTLFTCIENLPIFENFAPPFPEKEVRDMNGPHQSKENFSCVTVGTVARKQETKQQKKN